MASSPVEHLRHAHRDPTRDQGSSAVAGTPASIGAAASGAKSAPLTRRQTLFWLDEQLFPGVAFHNIGLLVELRGPLDVPRLEAAVERTVSDIDQLRLVLEVVDGEPRQRVRDDLRAQLEHADLSPDPQRVHEWIAERIARPFVFAKKLFDAALVRLGAERHVLYLCQHHIICDGVSVGHLVRHLADRYSGREAPVRPSYLDYVAAEADYGRSKRAERDASYWADKLGDGIPQLRYYGRTRTSRSVAVTRVWSNIGETRSAALRRLAAGEPMQLLGDSISLLVTLATSLFAYMYRVTGNRELSIGTPVANRGQRFLETCGLIMEQTFLAVEIDDGETFATLADKVRDEVFQSLRHGQYCVSDRGLDYVTLNYLVYQPASFDGLESEVRLSPAPTVVTSGVEGDLRATFGVQIHDFGGTQGISLGLDFHAATFDAPLIACAQEHLLHVLDAMTTDLQMPLDAVPLVGPAERERLLALAQGPEPAGAPPDLFDQVLRQAARRPTHVAVVAPDGTFTYAQFAARVHRLAYRLRELGVRRGERVGLYLSRGAGELSAMLATLEVGAAYVPLDPSHPEARVRLVLEDAAPRVLVTERALRPGLGLLAGVTVLELDTERALIDALPDAPPADARAASHDPHDVAYVLFTSGSTGRPKGVEVPRGAFANFLRSMEREPGLTEADRLLAVTTTTFDIAGLELMLPLWVGATVHIADRATVMDPRLLKQLLETNPVTVMQATPAGWRTLVEAGWRGSPSFRAFCGGEAVSAELAKELLARSAELWNLYGPTETTIWSTVKRLKPDDERITIGRPIDHTTVWILGPRQELVPQGVLGEICIGGRGLARGYLDRPELTADRFVANPHGPPGDRIYRTGDLGRLLPNGEIECAGRVDHQVKIRGFRIELGEIESVLAAVPGVAGVVVVARSEGSEGARLVAYTTGAEPSRKALQEAVASRLPVYMHPAAYVHLPSFPLNTNGKVDRKALPAPAAQPVGASALKRPTNDTETRMALLFQEVLGVSEVGVDTDFFAEGGTSLLVIRLRNLVQRELGVDLPLRVFFESPTVAGIVAQLGTRADPGEAIVVRLRAGAPGAPPLFCLLGVNLYQDLARTLPVDYPVIGMHVPVRYLPGRNPHPTVPEVARRYVELIRQRQPHGPYHLAGLCFGGVVAFEAAAQLVRRGETVRFVALFDAALPSALRIDPVQRAKHVMALLPHDPARVVARLREKGALLQERLSRLIRGARSTTSPSELVDLAVRGPGASAEVTRYEASIRPLPVEILLFRASDRSDEPPWESFRGDFGWRPYGSKLRAYDIPAKHLEVVREPAVRQVAAVLGELLR
ncbi:MAG: amino acid adenylation domain-containing protein [Deltaproteobacteria bacterium]|nr:amino acid adenylation domain-containing protein [Deltaproteobacteria bacterium]